MTVLSQGQACVCRDRAREGKCSPIYTASPRNASDGLMATHGSFHADTAMADVLSTLIWCRLRVNVPAVAPNAHVPDLHNTHHVILSADHSIRSAAHTPIYGDLTYITCSSVSFWPVFCHITCAGAVHSIHSDANLHHITCSSDGSWQSNGLEQHTSITTGFFLSCLISDDPLSDAAHDVFSALSHRIHKWSLNAVWQLAIIILVSGSPRIYLNHARSNIWY